MNDINCCPNHELLVTYLYDECDQAERESIDAHMALCASCAEEIQGLRDARVHLAAWSPPALPLGFQLTRTEAEPPATVLGMAGLASRSSKSEGWWRQPLPAWAQAAAAVVIFAAGMSAGAFRSPDTGERSTRVTEPPAAVVAQPATVGVSQEDLDGLETRLRALELHTKADSAQLVRDYRSGLENRELLGQLTTMVDQRVAQSDRGNLIVLEKIAKAIENDRKKVDERLSLVELEQQDVRQAFSLALGQSSLVRAASLR